MAANERAITDALSSLQEINYKTASVSIPTMLASGKFDASVYTPADSTTTEAKGIGRHLVFDNPDPDDPLSMFVFAFGPGQKTPIHDHNVECTVTVIDGVISEIYYKQIGDSNFAKLESCADRATFDIKRDDLDGLEALIHQLKRCKYYGDGISRTFHIYKMRAKDIDFNGNEIVNRNVNRTYEKYTSDKKERGTRVYEGRLFKAEPNAITSADEAGCSYNI